MPKSFVCIKCTLFLGEMEKGKIKKGAVLVCQKCWERASIAIEMADLAAGQANEFTKTKGSDSEVVDHLMGMFGMKK